MNTFPKPTSPSKTTRRILMTADPIGGVWNYALELARALEPHGVEIALATMGRALSPEQRREATAQANITLYESTFRLEWMDNPWEEVEQSGSWLLSLAELVRPDLVHLNGYAHASLPWPCPCLVVAHSCVLSWHEAVRKDEPLTSLATYRERIGRGLAAADLVVAPTAAMLTTLERLYQPLRKSAVVYNGRSQGSFRPDRKSDFILSAGRLWDQAKNMEMLSRVACALPWPVYVAGEKQQPQGSPVNLEHLHCMGLLPPQKMASWFGAAAVYAHPACYEPFGLTVLEAAMSRCALVLGDIPSLRELWQDAALFVPPHDFWAWSRTLRILCTDRMYREEMAERALTRSRSFTTARMAEGYLAAYNSLLATPQPDRSAAAGRRTARKRPEQNSYGQISARP